MTDGLYVYMGCSEPWCIENDKKRLLTKKEIEIINNANNGIDLDGDVVYTIPIKEVSV